MSVDKHSESFYVILDAARIFGEIDTAQKLQSKFLSLYKGESEQLLSSVAPYIFHYQAESEFSAWLNEKGWGHAWGVFVECERSLEELQNHFRKFLMVKTEDGKELYFRFYDPRVLRMFLPTCDGLQLRDFFGPVRSYLMEEEDPEFAVRFRLNGEQLLKDKISKADMLLIIGNSSDDNGAPSQKVKSVETTTILNTDKPDSNKGWTFMVD